MAISINVIPVPCLKPFTKLLGELEQSLHDIFDELSGHRTDVLEGDDF